MHIKFFPTLWINAGILFADRVYDHQHEKFFVSVKVVDLLLSHRYLILRVKRAVALLEIKN